MPDIQLGGGLPSVVPGASADLLLRWARGADASTFSTLGVHDRLAWDGFECLGVLNAAAAVTERIKLASLVLIAPRRNSWKPWRELCTMRIRPGLCIGI